MESKDTETSIETSTQSTDPSIIAPAMKKAARKHAGSKKTTVKTKSAKKAIKTKTAASAQAQTGPAIDVPFEKLNKVEQKLVKAVFTPKGDRKPYTIKELQKLAGAKTTLPVRNGLRKIVRAGWFEKYDRGTYRLTDKARKRSIAKGA